MSNVGSILFGFPQEIYIVKYKRRKYDRKPLSDYHTSTQKN